MTWVPLHVHSQYSILDALPSPKQLAKKAAEYGMPALALTDHGNLFGAVEFYKECKGLKINPIIGCEVYIAPESRLDKSKTHSSQRVAFHLTLLAKNAIGYHNLCKLSSIGYLEGFYYHPRIDKETLVKYSEGIICLSGCMSSSISHYAMLDRPDELRTEIEFFRNLFGEDFYLEIQRHEMSEEALHRYGFYQESWRLQECQSCLAKQNKINQKLIDASRELGIKLVATNDSHYIAQEDSTAHEILLNVQSGEPCEIWEKDSFGNPKFRIPNPKRRTYPTMEYYFKSPEQMAEIFKDIPEAVSNTLEVAEKCKVVLDFDTKHYPVYIPKELEGTEYTAEEREKASVEYLWKLCHEGIPKRYTAERLQKVQEIYPGQDPQQVIQDRLKYEMDVIVPKGMADYLLIVFDFIHWAKQNGIPMGPGRGSGAGSIVLYLIGITDIEPLRFSLFFERFINPERISYPDIDVDICMDRRGEVIKYTVDKYGMENVAQIITFGTMKAKMSVKDVGRVLSVPLAKVNMIAKLIPEDLNMTLSRALEVDPDLQDLYSTEEETKKLIDLALKLEGSVRNLGIHAAGLIICGDGLTNHIPLCRAKESDMALTQYSMKPVEMVGMLKVDFLGLKTLTSIQKAVDAIKEQEGISIDWVNLPLDDKPTFDLLNQGKTLGVFQLESVGMQELARNLHLDRFEEIIAVLSLYRPGPMDMIPSFIARKHGKEEIENDHPWMKEILAETYGIMVYQEQVMQIASKLANFSLGEGDLLRRAMGKKDMEQMASMRQKFVQGAAENNISAEVASTVFDKMEKFAAYGFNKSHAAAYGYLTYVTAYLKANYLKHWMAALMTCDRDDLSKVSKFIREAQEMDIDILPPDVNEAGKEFTATAKGIRFAMTGIKGVGEGVVDAIIEERKKGGPFTTVYSFFQRIDLKRVGKKVIENLVSAGAFDFTNWSRDALIESLEEMYDTALRQNKEASLGIMNLFDQLNSGDKELFKLPPQVKNPISKQDLLMKEKELLGFFLTGHPLDLYKKHLQSLSCVSFETAKNLGSDPVFRAVFIVESVNVRISAKNSKKFAILTISDGIEHMELPIWSDIYEEKHTLIGENRLLYGVLQLENRDPENVRLSCKWICDLTTVDQAVIQECDQAFDKAKFQAQLRIQQMQRQQDKNEQQKQLGSKSQVMQKEEKRNTEAVNPVQLRVDLDKMTMKNILELKKIFQQHPGSRPVCIVFHDNVVQRGTLYMDQQWGISISEEFTQKIALLESGIIVM